MATTDPFSAQIVELVRQMPDEAILALVKNQLGAFGGAPAPLAAPKPAPAVAASAPARRRGRPPRVAAVVAAPAAAAAPKRRPPPPRRGRGRPPKSEALSPDRIELLEKIERLIKASSGMSASDVSKALGLQQTRAAAALKELKVSKRIYQGGDRRFARYAGDAKTAEQASLSARRSASGPLPVAAPPPPPAPMIAPRKRGRPRKNPLL